MKVLYLVNPQGMWDVVAMGQGLAKNLPSWCQDLNGRKYHEGFADGWGYHAEYLDPKAPIVVSWDRTA